jgi:hypothetical protein
MKYNKLSFIEECGKSKDNHIMWKCRCDCGDIYIGLATRIKHNRVKSCKKCSVKASANKLMKHGMRNTLEYSSWTAMKDRCLNPKSKDYYKYGGAGIYIHQEWIDSFEKFYAYMGKKEKGQSIDRIDNSKGYIPGNVRWANNNTQQRNKDNSIWLDWKGKLTHISDIAKDLNITRGAAIMRYKRGKLNEA